MKKLNVVKVLSVFVLILALPGAAAADPVIAEVENQGNALVFHPVTEYETLILTVTGPCDFRYRQVVDREGTPFFQLDGTTIDGRYTYNLQRNESVDPGIVKILRRARQNFDEETPRALCRDGKLPAAPIAQSEGFGVRRGKVVYDPGAFEKDLTTGDFDVPAKAHATTNASFASDAELGIPLKDFVINDDLIVDGSACIGFDCVNGEVFSFDTIRLKENNLRIKFDDTSVAASFPRNDWQLTANESANGGASKFSIEDISGGRTPFTVEANARSHSLYVDDGGRIGSRTSTPSVEIHTIDGDTPTLRLQQDGSSGFEPQTWDVAGNETNFFIRDVTNGSALPFRIRPGAPSSSIFIDVDGDVGLGTSSPDDPLHLLQTDANKTTLRVENSNAAAQNTEVVLQNTAQEWLFRNNTAGDFVINVPGDAGFEFHLDDAGNLTVQGNLVTGGGGSCDPGPCDGTFTDYELESIEKHAEYMWKNNHLWGVGPTPEGAPINVSKKTTGILHELEKAHIYIEQLNASLKGKDGQLAELQARMAALEAVLGLAP